MHPDKKWPIFFGYLFKFLSQIKEFLLSFRIPGMSFFSPNKPRNILSAPLAEFLASRIKRLSFSVHLCDPKVAALSTQFSLRWEVILMDLVLSFILSVAAGVVSNYISKWLDGKHKDSKH